MLTCFNVISRQIIIIPKRILNIDITELIIANIEMGLLEHDKIRILIQNLQNL